MIEAKPRVAGFGKAEWRQRALDRMHLYDWFMYRGYGPLLLICGTAPLVGFALGVYLRGQWFALVGGLLLLGYYLISFETFGILLVPVLVPGGLVFTVLLVGIALIPKRKRKHRRQSKYCTSCEYDLTGNTTGKCPECGTTLSAEKRRFLATFYPGVQNLTGHRPQ